MKTDFCTSFYIHMTTYIASCMDVALCHVHA